MDMYDDGKPDFWHLSKLDYLRDKMHAELRRRDPSHPKTEYGEWDSENCPVCNPDKPNSDNLSKQQFTSPRSK